MGVGYGTPWLYKAFPSARFELFEPLGVFEPTMKRICALGSERTETTIESDAGVPTGSTMAGRDASLSLIKSSRRQQNPEKTKVQVHKLDEFGPFAAPILLKLDVEGFESEVLKGATATLANTDIIISEVSVTQRHNNEMSFGGFMNFMESLGFSLIEFPEFTQVRRDGPLAYVDAAFARSDSPFRR